ncbi:MAG: hypothetical protein WC260_04180 [Candidatus Pacearchaeota archaeon]
MVKEVKKNKKVNNIKKVVSKKDKNLTLEDLEKTMNKLANNFELLSNNMSKLLKIFEDSARELAKTEKNIPESISAKIDSLLNQNKIINKGLNNVEEKLKISQRSDISTEEGSKEEKSQEKIFTLKPKPLPRIE